MGWSWWPFGRASPQQESKAVDISPEMWAAINGGWGLPTKSGSPVSVSSALGLTAYYRAILVIAEGVAQLPVAIYRQLPGGRGAEPATDHPLYDLLMHQPSAWQDSMGFFCTALMHAAGTGNSVSYRVQVNGVLRELIPIKPEAVSITLDHIGRVMFDIAFETGQTARVGQEHVFHIAGPSWAAYKGLDPAVVGREAIGLAQATEEAHSRLHSNGARPSGILSTEKQLDPAQVALLREQWQQTQGGLENAMKTAILGGGLKWTQMAMTGVDAEHLDTRKLQIEEIARLLGVFPIMLGHAGDQSPTFASADAFLEAHVRWTLQPWIKRVRSAVNTQLLTKDERDEGYHCRIDASELLRGSLKDRTEYYKAGLGTNSNPGWLTGNEVREDDGWNPVDGLDDVMSPLTMAPAGAEPVAPNPAAAPAPEPQAAAADQGGGIKP